MKKLWIIMLSIIVIVIGILTGLVINRITTKEDNIVENAQNKLSEKIEDECTDEWEYLQEQAKLELEANSSEEKISPNCLLVLRKYYTECEHMISEYLEIPENLVNKGQKELEEEYPNWKIEKYSSIEIILFKEFESNCGQHYILKNDEGKISIYTINEQNEEEFYKRTEISVEYLPENDKIQIEKGIRVNGKQELNELLENFE